MKPTLPRNQYYEEYAYQSEHWKGYLVGAVIVIAAAAMLIGLIIGALI